MKIPPFRVFAQSSGLPTAMPMAYDPGSFESNLLVDIPTLTYWYWMMCGITIDLGYTIDGGIKAPIRHRYYLDGQKYLPPMRLLHDHWTINFPMMHDDEWDITSVCWLLLNQPRCDTLPQILRNAQLKHLQIHPNSSTLWRNTPIPANTRFGICFRFQEYADDHDFDICTLKSDVHTNIIGTYKAKFLGHEVPFYLSTPYPDEITAHFDFINITPEFFEIDPNAPT